MNTIEAVNHVDMLEGKAIEYGEKLELLFPDGKKETRVVLTKKKAYPGKDGEELFMVKSFFQFSYNGIPVLCPLAGLKAKRVG